MEELLMCSVCIERYHETSRHPVLLPRCGHSFCRPCIAMLVSSGCVVCPTCRTDQRVDQVERLPTEYTLLAIISAQESSKKETCERHSVKLSFWCRTCEKSTCGECLFEDHPTHSHDVIRASMYISNMKQNAQDVAIKFIEVLDEREQFYYSTIFSCAKKISHSFRNIGVLRKDMEEARELMKGIKEDESISAATSLSEAAKFLGLKWNIQDANLHRKVKEEKVKDEIDLEKEKAQEADKKEQEEKKAAREKKRALRKSKTMSSVDMMKEASKIADKAKNEGEKEPGKGETPKPEAETPKEIAPEDEKKVKEIAEPKKEPKAVKQEEITIHDIIKMKDLLKRTEDPSHANETKEINNKLEKIPELPKLKPKFPRIKPPVKKPLNPQATDAKSPVETLPVIQEKEAEVAAEAIPAKPEAENKEKEVKTSNAEDTVAISDDEDSDIESPAKTEDIGASATVESINPDSGLSESSKSKPAKDPMEDMADPEGKLSDFIQVPGFMICAEAADGRLAFMEWGPQGLHVHCLQFMHVTYDIVIRDTILNTMIPSKSPIVFLELTAEQTIIGRVYIKLWGQLRRAHNFLSLCLGDQGKSFMNTKFLQVYNVSGPGERILGGDYENNNGRGGRGVIDDLEWNGDYAMPMKEGMITAAGSGQNATNSLFLICTETDLDRNFSCPFGLVCEGLKVVRDAIQETATKQIWITDCGVLITPPKFESSIQT